MCGNMSTSKLFQRLEFRGRKLDEQRLVLQKGTETWYEWLDNKGRVNRSKLRLVGREKPVLIKACHGIKGRSRKASLGHSSGFVTGECPPTKNWQ